MSPEDSATSKSEDNNNDSDMGTDGANSTRPSTTVARATTVAPTSSGTGGGPSSSDKQKATSTNFLQYSVTEPASKKKKYIQKGLTPKKLLAVIGDAASYLADRPTFNKFDKKLEKVRKQEYYLLKAVCEAYKKIKEEAIVEDSMAVDGDDEPRSALPHCRNDEDGAPGANSASGVSA